MCRRTSFLHYKKLKMNEYHQNNNNKQNIKKLYRGNPDEMDHEALQEVEGLISKETPVNIGQWRDPKEMHKGASQEVDAFISEVSPEVMGVTVEGTSKSSQEAFVLETETLKCAYDGESESKQTMSKHEKLRQKRRRRKDKQAVVKMTNQINSLLSEETTPEVERPEKRFKGANPKMSDQIQSRKGKDSRKKPIRQPSKVVKIDAAKNSADQKPSSSCKTNVKPKRSAKVGETFAQVANSDLTLGITDMSMEGPLENTHVNAFKTSLLCALDDLCDDAGDIGFVGNAKLVDGFIVLRCKNQSTKSWFIKLAQTLTNLWEGAKLRVDNLHALRNEVRMMIIAHGSTEGKDIILKRLQKQNGCVKDTSKWRVPRAEKFADAAKEGVVLTVWCPKEDAEAIRKAGGRLNCGLDQAVVKFMRNEQ